MLHAHEREREREREMDSRVKVVMFPWLANGHISPFLELAKKLSRRNFDIYICSTPANLNSIKKKVTQDYSLSIHLLELHLSTDELPPHFHTTSGLPLHLNPTLFKTLKMAKPNISNLLKTLQPHLLIYDVLLPWLRSLASLHKIPVATFFIYCATICSYYSHLRLRPGIEFPFPAIRDRLTDYELSSVLPKSHESTEDDDHDDDDQDLIVLINSSRAIEGKYIDYVSELVTKVKMTPVGALVQDFNSEDDDDDDDKELMEWLGRKEEGSSVLVAVGTEYFLKREEIEETAYGLEMINVNFIWVIRSPMGEEIRVQDSLPLGFVDRVKERGRIVEKWAPQVKILKHSSIGGFVSHCGWNSVLESIDSGVPIIAIPMHFEQPLNAKVVVEIGVGLEVVRDGNGRLQRGDISRVINDVVLGEIGKTIRKTLQDLNKTVRSRSNQEMEEAVHNLTLLSGNISSHGEIE